MKSYDEFLNEEINWGKKPWVWLKNIMNLEESELEEDEEDELEVQSPNDIVTLSSGFQISILKDPSPQYTVDALKELAKALKLTGKIEHLGSSSYKFALKGKRKNANKLYDILADIIRN